MSQYPGDQGRSETPPYEQGGSWGGPSGSGPSGYGPSGHGQPNPYLPAYPQPYGEAPAKPGTVVTAAVFGFILGACGVLVTIGFFFGATVAQTFFDALGSSGELSPGESAGLDAGQDVFTGVFVVIGILALAWTVLTFWGSVWALTGRSRVILLVTASIGIALTGISLLFILVVLGQAPSGTDFSDATGSVLVQVAAFLVTLLTVVLLSVSSASRFFAAHRARRGR